MFALAMGKMGRASSIIRPISTLIMLFDGTRHPPDAYGELRRGFIRITQRLVRLLSETTRDGYVFPHRPAPQARPVGDAGGDRDRAGRALL